ncbi:MAG: sigma-70 family RNA polymerase sigma factor [Kiritimatiellae bacterium]|nr:sigma-70 family RNA polymerase sigma factor [Kiritimatiellia bacterium]
MTDEEWLKLVREGEDAGWKLVWERVVEPEAGSSRSVGLMRRYSITAGDLMGMLYEDMIGRGKINLFRGEGSLEGWLRRYVRGYILNANPNQHGEISIEGAHPDNEGEQEALVLPTEDKEILRGETWRFTHWIFRKLWNTDPVRCYVHVLKTRYFLSSEEIRDFLEISSTSNVDQIYSRSIKFMRETWVKHV